MMNNNGTINEIAGFATIAICIMTFISFGMTTGLWEEPFWCSGMEIIDYEGYWGEDIIVTYTDGQTESVKQISNSYWDSMSIRDDSSKPIVTIQYCINALIPVSDVFNTREYRCAVFIVQDGVDFYQTSYATTDSIDVGANEWTRIITVPLNIQTISNNWNDGIYTVSFENAGTIEGIAVPDGRSIDIVVTGGVITFLI